MAVFRQAAADTVPFTKLWKKSFRLAKILLADFHQSEVILCGRTTIPVFS